MRRVMGTLLIAALTLPAAALAQDKNSSSGVAQAANTVNVIAQAGDPNPADTSIRHSGHTWTTPVVGGSYISGANPCLVGTGGGAAGGPIGFSLNLGKSDEGCNRRSDAAAWNAMGFQAAAMARMCQDQKNADAFFASTGMACPGTQRNGRYKLADGSEAPVAPLRNTNMPVPLPEPEPAAQQAPPPAVVR